MTRRELLLWAAKAGGAGFAYHLMEDLGFVTKPEGTELRPLQGATSKKGSVVILGAGLAGMCAAYELENLGYTCTLLEARSRTGGRCISIRHGDKLEESGEPQVCDFESGHYFNPGPTRVPHWHITIDYCRKFGVAVAPWININEGAFVYQTKAPTLTDRRIRLRDVIADTEGYMAELAAKSVKANLLDEQLSEHDKAQVLSYIGRYGYLARDGHYHGDSRRAFRTMYGAGPLKSVTEKPLKFEELFRAGMGGYFRFINGRDQQMTMLEIVGGVDGIARAFEKQIRSPILFGSQVVDIRTGDSKVEVTCKDQGGTVSTVSGDYCICTIPLSVLKKIPANFDSTATRAIKRTLYAASTKVATEYGRRFWEEDDHIFGGISWTDQDISQIIYPSTGFLGRSGVLVNYSFGAAASRQARITPSRRIESAMSQVAKIHPQAPKELKSAVTLAWSKVPFSEGAFVAWELSPYGTADYEYLCRPQGRLYFAGEHMSHMTAWMAGAFESARYVVKQIATHAQV